MKGCHLNCLFSHQKFTLGHPINTYKLKYSNKPIIYIHSYKPTIIHISTQTISYKMQSFKEKMSFNSKNLKNNGQTN